MHNGAAALGLNAACFVFTWMGKVLGRPLAIIRCMTMRLLQECHDSHSSCQECIGDVPLESVVALERWTDAQQASNAKREAAWTEAQRWDWGVESSFSFSEADGVVRKPAKESNEDRQKAGAGRKP